MEHRHTSRTYSLTAGVAVGLIAGTMCLMTASATIGSDQLSVAPADTIAGTVVSAQSERPLPGVELAVIDSAGFVVSGTTASVSAADGTFTISGVGHRPYRLQVAHFFKVNNRSVVYVLTSRPISEPDSLSTWTVVMDEDDVRLWTELMQRENKGTASNSPANMERDASDVRRSALLAGRARVHGDGRARPRAPSVDLLAAATWHYTDRPPADRNQR